LVPAEPEGCPEYDFIFYESEILIKMAENDDFPIPAIFTLPYDKYGICEWEKGKPGKWKFLENPRWQITIADY